jgi:hypothetical protein
MQPDLERMHYIREKSAQLCHESRRMSGTAQALRATSAELTGASARIIEDIRVAKGPSPRYAQR